METYGVVTFSQDESSEEFIGEWMESRKIRDQLVIATKVSEHDILYRLALINAHTIIYSTPPASSVLILASRTSRRM